MNCIVTAGPTYAPLDAVRRLTNFSTGKLGTELARHLASGGHSVILLRSEAATFTKESGAKKTFSFTTNDDLAGRLQAFSPEKIDAVFHAAAVSDFSFGAVWRHDADDKLVEVQEKKIRSRQGKLMVELIPAPKIINRLRDWFPAAWLAGWKYEVDGERSSALAHADAQIRESRTDACVANGPAYGPGFGMLLKGKNYRHVADSVGLFEILEASAQGHDL